MTFIVPKDTSSSGLLTVPMRLFTSNGTSPDTGASNDSIRLSANGASDFTATNKLSALSAAAGMYTLLLTQSEVSTLGSLVGWHWQGDFPQHVFTVQVVNNNPMSTQSNLSDVTLAAKEYSNVTVRLGLVAYSGATVGVGNIAAGSYSGVTVQGVTRVNSSVTPANAEYSAVTVRLGLVDYSGATVGVGNIKAGSYSGVTVGIDNLKAGSYSGVTIQGVTRTLSLSANDDKTGYSISGTKTTLDALNDIDGSGVTLHAGTHSGATIQGLTRALNLSANGDKTGYSISGTKTTLDALNDIDGSGVTLHAGTHSGATIQGVTRVNSSVTIADGAYSAVSVQVDSGGIQAGSIGAGALTSAKFGASAIDAAALASDAVQEIADGLLGRNIAGGSDGGRTVSEALYPLRNRVQIQGSTMTVYQVNDSTSAWTASITTGTNPMSGMDPV